VVRAIRRDVGEIVAAPLEMRIAAKLGSLVPALTPKSANAGAPRSVQLTAGRRELIAPSVDPTPRHASNTCLISAAED